MNDKHTKGDVYIQEQDALKELCELKGIPVPEDQKYMRTNDGDYLINFKEGNRLCQVQFKANPPKKKDAYKVIDPEGLANAARLCAGWNLLNRLEAIGISPERAIELLEAVTDEDFERMDDLTKKGER